MYVAIMYDGTNGGNSSQLCAHAKLTRNSNSAGKLVARMKVGWESEDQGSLGGTEGILEIL